MKPKLEMSWFQGKQSVLVTAGASAPEHLVEALLKRLHAEFGATIQQRNLVERTCTSRRRTP
jgi:4-hydroxy-3-methylbut-2-enyl diphosphate reductase IspH